MAAHYYSFSFSKECNGSAKWALELAYTWIISPQSPLLSFVSNTSWPLLSYCFDDKASGIS
jgi:hypothetical protein